MAVDDRLQVLKRGVRGQRLEARLRDSSGPVDLADASGAQVKIAPEGGDGEAIADFEEAEILDADTGFVAWLLPDTAEWPTGLYRVDWWVDWSDGSRTSFPHDGYDRLRVI